MKYEEFIFNYVNLWSWCALSYHSNFDAFCGSVWILVSDSFGCVHLLCFKTFISINNEHIDSCSYPVWNVIYFSQMVAEEFAMRFILSFSPLFFDIQAIFYQHDYRHGYMMTQYIFIIDKTIFIECLCYRIGRRVMCWQKSSFNSCIGASFQILVDISSFWLHLQRLNSITRKFAQPNIAGIKRNKFLISNIHLQYWSLNDHFGNVYA